MGNMKRVRLHSMVPQNSTLAECDKIPQKEASHQPARTNGSAPVERYNPLPVSDIPKGHFSKACPTLQKCINKTFSKKPIGQTRPHFLAKYLLKETLTPYEKEHKNVRHEKIIP